MSYHEAIFNLERDTAEARRLAVQFGLSAAAQSQIESSLRAVRGEGFSAGIKAARTYLEKNEHRLLEVVK